MKLSLCIPTFNRALSLDNCLHSIVISAYYVDFDFEVIVSSNCSTDDTDTVVSQYTSTLPLVYSKNSENLGIPQNFLKVVSLAKGEFVWLIGDDDLLLPNSLLDLFKLLNRYPHVDFFYVNSYKLSFNHITAFAHPFDTYNLPKKMQRFSNYSSDGQLDFLDLIHPSISFDFLGGMYLSVFRHSHWSLHSHILCQAAVYSHDIFSHFDNTFPHVRIFSRAFSQSKAYFNSKPLIVSLSGIREWSSLYPLVRSIRLIEALDSYREVGLPFYKYYYCRNYTLAYFIPDFIFMCLNPHKSGIKFVSFKQLLPNLLFPNFYFSILTIFMRKLRSFFFAVS